MFSATERRACIIPKLRLHIVLDKGSCNFQNKHDRSLLHYHVSWAHGLSACRAFAIHLLHNVVDTEEANLVDQSLPSVQTDFRKKKNWKMVAGFNGLVVAGTGKKWYVRLIQGLHAKWTWFILAMHCGSLEFQSVFGHKTPLSSSSSSPITQLRTTNAARHLGSFDMFFPCAVVTYSPEFSFLGQDWRQGNPNW